MNKKTTRKKPSKKAPLQKAKVKVQKKQTRTAKTKASGKTAAVQVDWPKAMARLIKEYSGKKHPLDYQNRYQLVVAVVLSAQDSDRHINKVAPPFFEKYPTLQSLSGVQAEELYPLLSSVRGFRKKSTWLTTIAREVQTDDRIPTTMAELTKLPGIGRKSASVIIRESGGPAEGIIVDLHVVRVSPRLGIATTEKPDKIEKELMAALPKDQWGEAGMAISFLGREICRPTGPKCEICVMKTECAYYKNLK